MNRVRNCLYCQSQDLGAKMLALGQWQVVCRQCGAAGPVMSAAEEAWQRWRQPVRELVLLRTVAESSPNMVILKDAQGRFLYGNPALAQLYGTTPEALVGKDDSAFNPNVDQVRSYQETIRQVLASGQTELIQEQSTDAATGETRYYQSIKKPLINAEGEPCVLILATDVTALRQAHQEIALREQSYFHAMDAAGDAVWDWDITHDTITHNAKWSEVLGFDVELQRHPVSVFAGLIHVDDRESTMLAVQAALEGKGDYQHEHRMVREDGQIIWVHDRGKVVARDEQGRALRMAGAFTDISERKLNEATIHRLMAEKDAILKSGLIGVAILRERRIIWVNHTLTNILGYSESELTGMPIRALYLDEESYLQAGRDAYSTLAEGKPFRAELAFRRKDGLTGWLAVSGVMTGEGDGSSIWAYLDITEHKRIEAKLIEAQAAAQSASRAKSEFLANMSHEIRTPLNAVLGMVYLLRQTGLDTRQQGYLGNIDESTHLLLGIINDILDYSKIESGRIELESAPFELGKVLQTVGTLAYTAARGKPVEVLFRVAPDVPDRLVGDALRLQQVLINLVGNAIKFTEAGVVELTISAQGDSEEKGRWLRISVTDTGIGMTEAQIQRLFQPFTQAESSTTRRFGGTGLGLVISKRLVALMGGNIDVVSTLGQGSRFNLVLPLRVSSTASLPAVVTSPFRVWLVVTHPVAREADHETCRQLGWVVECCEEAALPGALAEGKTPDLILWAASPDSPVLSLLGQMPSIGSPAGLPAFLLLGNPESSVLARFVANKRAALLPRPYTRSQLASAAAQLCAPAASEKGGAPVQPAPSKPVAGMRILVAEDSPINQIVIQEILELAGASVTIAENGLACLDCLRSRPNDFDLILMDMHMPEMDGIEATRQLRHSMQLMLPVIALTANTQESDREACEQAGMNAFISKPVDPDELISLLAAYRPRILVPGHS